MFAAADIIYAYTRADALADGVLVDVSVTAREAGFKCPVAMTRAAWADCVEWTDATDQRKDVWQDEAGRLWDVLHMAMFAARRGGNDSRVEFTLLRVPVEGRGNLPRETTLVMEIGPGDQGEMVITIMQPGED